MKKICLFVFAAAILCCCAAGCFKKKSVKLTVKLPVMSMRTVNDPDITETVQFLKKAAEEFSKEYREADVSFKIEEFEYTREDIAISGSFDGNNATDILYEGYFNMSTYIHTGRVVPLDDIISDELRGDVEQKIWDMSMADGRTYMMPFLSLQNVLTYNKEMFRQCGLDKYVNDAEGVIDSWSLEDWEYILDTLAQRLPENCYPMMMYAHDNQGDTHIMTFIRCLGSDIFDENGSFNLETEEGVAGLEWLRDGYGRGWYPPKCENIVISDNMELFGNNQLAIMLTNNASFSKLDADKYGYVNFPSSDGKGYCTSFVTGFEVFDNGDERKLAASKAFVKYLCETPRWADYSTGGVPARSSVAEKYEDQVFMLKACMENRKNAVDFTRNNPNWRGVRDVFYPHIQDLLTGRKSPEQTAKEIDSDCNAAIEQGRSRSRLHQ